VFAWQLQFATAHRNMGEHLKTWFSPPEDLLWLVPQIAELCRISCLNSKSIPATTSATFGNPEPDLRDADRPCPFWLGLSELGMVIGTRASETERVSLPASSMLGEARSSRANVRRQSLRDI